MGHMEGTNNMTELHVGMIIGGLWGILITLVIVEVSNLIFHDWVNKL